MKALLVPICLACLLAGAVRGGELAPHAFEFDYEGEKLRGYVDLTEDEATALIVIIHGHGPSAVAQGQWSDLRSTFTQMGIATCVWDKAGCGESEGTYDHEQSVADSAREVRAAIEALRARYGPGSQRIGLWGISRAGWICPLVIEQDPSIAFWISVSGTDGKESFGYLLRSNFRIEGRSEEQVDRLYDEWLESNRIFQSGGTWNAFRGNRSKS